MNTKKIKVAVVDDQQLFRQGMISLLREFEGIHVLFEAANGTELMNELRDNFVKPDVVLLDLEMPEMDGIEAMTRMNRKYPDIKVLILTMHTEHEMIVYMIEHGANGFLAKNEDIERVVDAISSAHDTGYYFNDHVSQAMIKGMVKSKKIRPQFDSVKLTDIEIEIVKLICKENTNKEIAKLMQVSSRTIDGHRLRILEKLKARNTAGIVMYAMKNGLIV